MTFEDFWKENCANFPWWAMGDAAKAAYEAGVKAEREACARVCDERPNGFTFDEFDRACVECAKEIRNRGEK